MNNPEILASWELVKDTPFGKWLSFETDKAVKEAIDQMMVFNDIGPLMRVQGFHAGLRHWESSLMDMRRDFDNEARKRKSIWVKAGLMR